jgi:hypothetical protein
MDYSSFVRPRRAEPRSGRLDLDQLLHPARAFSHPNDVVNDSDLPLNEKRAILSSWASDACAVESASGLRLPPGASRPVTFDDILDALKALDASAPRRRSGCGDEGTPIGA